MSHGPSADLMFSSHRKDAVPGTTRSPGGDDLTKVLDRIEQLEFAVAEAVVLFEARDGVHLPDPSQALADLTVRIDTLAGRLAGLAAVSERAMPPKEQIDRMATRLDALSSTRADELSMMEARFSGLEAALDTRLAPVEAVLQTMATQLQDLQKTAAEQADAAAIDRADLKDGQARMAKQVAELVNMQAPPGEMAAATAQVAHLSDRFTTLEKVLGDMPGAGALSDLRIEVGAALQRAHHSEAARFDEMVVLIDTLSSEVKAALDLGPDMAQFSDLLMARMDRLDTAADLRQRELTRTLSEAETSAVQPDTISPIRDMFTRLMVALQGMHQSRETAEAALQTALNGIGGDIRALPDRLEAGDSARARNLVREMADMLGHQSPPHLKAKASAAEDDTNHMDSALPAPPSDMSEWMQRQDAFQAALSELLGSLVEQGGRHADHAATVEEIKTLIAAGHFTARKQVETLEDRLCGRLNGLAETLNAAASLAGPDISMLHAVPRSSSA